jgi:carboxypeptidase C (cathepsin A)
MNDLQPAQTDWVHLAANVEVRPIWDTLHDSTLVSCTSDLLARTVRMRFTSGHLVPDNPEAAFGLLLSEVTSSRAT